MILSVLSEPLLGNYTDGKRLVRFGYLHIDATGDFRAHYPKEVESYGEATFEEFGKSFRFLERTIAQETVDNYATILDRLGRQTMVCFILGPTMQSTFGEGGLFCQSEDVVSIYRELNGAMKAGFGSRENAFFIDPADYYRSPRKKSQLYYYNCPSMLHYPRRTYVLMAKQLHRLFPRSIKYDKLYGAKRGFRHMREWVCSILKGAKHK